MVSNYWHCVVPVSYTHLKAFLLPQENPEAYLNTFKSYNIPELYNTAETYDAHELQKAYFGKETENLLSLIHIYFDHEQPEELVQGRLTTNIPVIGSNYDDLGQSKGKNNVFWILTLTDEYITLYHPCLLYTSYK